MTLLGDIQAALENHPELTIVGIDYHHVFGRFNTHAYRVAPSTTLDKVELGRFLGGLRVWIPKEPDRCFDFTDRVNPYGELYYTETIGKEKVIRSFTVDDASNFSGKGFKIGLNEPEERDLIRAIKVMLYPTVREARLHKYGLTFYESPASAAA